MNKDLLSHYIFDLYGTLVDIHTDEEKPEVWERLSARFRELGADCGPELLRQRYAGEIRKQKEALSIVVPMAEHAEVRLESVFWRMLTACGIRPTEQDVLETGRLFRKASTEYIRLYPGAEELLRMLREQGSVWLLSNAQSIFTRPELEELGIGRYFTGIFISSEQLCKKPDAHFYGALLGRENIRPGEAVMIGNDQDCDIRGARNAGLGTVYLRSGLSPENDMPDADIVLDPIDLNELARILKK